MEKKRIATPDVRPSPPAWPQIMMHRKTLVRVFRGLVCKKIGVNAVITILQIAITAWRWILEILRKIHFYFHFS